VLICFLASVSSLLVDYYSLTTGSLTRHSTLATRPSSLDYFVRPVQHRLWNCEADLLGGFQIDDELKLLRLLHGEIRWLRALQNLVHVNSGAPVQVEQVHAIGHEPAGFHIHSIAVYDR
jgi:hypothetical protein